MVNLNVRGLLKATVVAGTLAFTGAASAASVDGAVCDLIPEATQGQWDIRKATKVTKDLFQKMGQHTDDDGVLNAGAFKTDVESLLRGVKDSNLSYFPQQVRTVAQARHDQALDKILKGGVGKLLSNDDTSQEVLDKAAGKLFKQQFPSLGYQNAAVDAVRTGSWITVASTLGEVMGREISTVQTALQDTLTCRAEHNAKLTLNP